MRRFLQQLTQHLLRWAQVMALPGYTYWGFCPVCGETTPWYADAWRGHYECMRCHSHPLDESVNRQVQAGV